MAAWSQSKGLTGFQKHFETQGHGEIGHAMKIYKYLVDTGSQVDLPAIPSPSKLASFSNMQEACRAALSHEMVVTRRWQVIGEKAKSEPNLATQELAQWFMTEQVEEEDLSMTLLNKVELADTGAGLLIVDAGLK
jgi:ferritin